VQQESEQTSKQAKNRTFWMTWLPFWSLTQRISAPSSSATMLIFCSRGSTSSAFWITRQLYSCRDSDSTCAARGMQEDVQQRQQSR
jgi:hypothetical protein